MKNGTYLPPRILQVIGILLLIGSAIFWAYTGRESLLFISAALSLIGIGTVQGIRVTLSQSPDANLDKDV
jgi:hypothetical protein